MSSEEDNEVDLDSIHLVEYLKKPIPVEKLRDFSSSKRIGSIDFVKGVASLGSSRSVHSMGLNPVFSRVIFFTCEVYGVRT